jgi:surfeit locus 1 family protein
MPIRFRLRPIPLLATVVVVAIGISLGQWQTRRGDEKQAIEATVATRAAAAPLNVGTTIVDPASVEFARVRVRGVFDADWPLFLDNRPLAGKAGFYVLMPLKIEGSDIHVLVERGWAPRDRSDRLKLPTFRTPSGPVEIEGMARKNAGHVMQLGSAPKIDSGAVLQNLPLPDLAAATGFALQPFVLEQATDIGDGLVRDWPQASSGIDKHRGYAVQWYGLALMACLFFIVTGFRRGTK